MNEVEAAAFALSITQKDAWGAFCYWAYRRVKYSPINYLLSLLRTGHRTMAKVKNNEPG
jgi:hypothetical protein